MLAKNDYRKSIISRLPCRRTPYLTEHLITVLKILFE